MDSISCSHLAVRQWAHSSYHTLSRAIERRNRVQQTVWGRCQTRKIVHMYSEPSKHENVEKRLGDWRNSPPRLEKCLIYREYDIVSQWIIDKSSFNLANAQRKCDCVRFARNRVFITLISANVAIELFGNLLMRHIEEAVDKHSLNANVRCVLMIYSNATDSQTD